MAKTLGEFAQLEPLWEKAIQHPADISPEEKHQLMEWPPLEEMRAKASNHLGMSLEDLLQKAATDPHSLTYPECRLIRDKFRIMRLFDSGNRFAWRWKRPDLYSKRNQARDAILTQTELQAVRAVDEVFYQKQSAEFKAIKAKRQQEPPPHMPREWVQKIIDQKDDKSWGYIFYHHKAMAGWDEFMEIFNKILELPLFYKGEEEILDFKFAQFIPFETEESELGVLRQDFQNRRERGDLKPGVLKNVFFLLTDEARSSYYTNDLDQFSGYIWAIDPDWLLSGPDEDGYDGRLKIHVAQPFFRFYEFMSTKFSLKDVWRDFNFVNSNKPYPSWIEEPTAWFFTHLDKPVWPYN